MDSPDNDYALPVATGPLTVTVCILLALLGAKRAVALWQRPAANSSLVSSSSSPNRTRTRRLPGPPRLPLLGSYPFMQLPYRSWLAPATRRYGDVFTFWLAGQQWVSLNSYELIHSALVVNGDALSGRPRGLWSERVFRGSGLALGEGPVWQKHRKLVLRVFRDVGHRKLNLTSMVHEELLQCLDELDTSQPVSSEMFSSVTANIIFRIIFGLRATDDKDFGERLRAVQTIVQRDVYATFLTAVLLPVFMKFPSLLYRVKEVRTALESIETLLAFIEKRIEKSAQSYNKNYEPSDFVKAVAEHKGMNSQGDFSEGKLAVTVMDLLIGGTDSTSSSLKWICLYLATRPEYQEELAGHVIASIGSRQATSADWSRIPQLAALIAEVQRLHPPLPTAINHRAKADVNVCGYAIPSGAWVFPNLRAAHRDPRIFESPDEFKPDRFLAADGSCQLPPQLATFSVGPRACPGEWLAQKQTFMTMAELLSRYRIRLTDADAGRVSDLMLGSDGLVSAPKPYSMLMEPREG